MCASSVHPKNATVLMNAKVMKKSAGPPEAQVDFKKLSKLHTICCFGFIP